LLDADGAPVRDLGRPLGGRRYATTAGGMLEQLVEAPIAIYWLAVDDTLNEARSNRDILERASTQTLDAPSVLDLATERRRRALNRHREAMSAANRRLLFHCFNPGGVGRHMRSRSEIPAAQALSA